MHRVPIVEVGLVAYDASGLYEVPVSSRLGIWMNYDHGRDDGVRDSLRDDRGR